MAIPQEKFTSIKSEVLDVLSVLFESFNPDLDVEQQLAAHHEALGKYVNRVARIGMAASVVGYKGLRDVCVVFQERLRELHKARRILTAQERELLEEWPMLVMSYLTDAGNPQAAEDIIRHLHGIIVPGALSEYEFDELAQHLQDDGKPLAAAETRMLLDEPAALKQATLSDPAPLPEPEPEQLALQEPAQSLPADEPELQNQFDTHSLQDVADETRDAVDELIATLDEINRDSQSTAETAAALHLCADRMELLAMSIASSGLMGLMDIILMIQEGLSQLAEAPQSQHLQTDTLGMWSELVGRYLQNPDNPDTSIELIGLMQQIPWLNPISESEADTLLTLLIPEEINLDQYIYTENSAEPESAMQIEETAPAYREPEVTWTAAIPPSQTAGVTSADPEMFSPLSIPQAVDKSAVQLSEGARELIALVKMEIEAVQAQLNELLTTAIETEITDQRVETLNEYLEQLERFVLATDSVGLQGLANAIGHLSAIVHDMVERQDLTAEQGLMLAEWPTHVLAYLNDVNRLDLVNALLEFLVNPEWPVQMSQDSVVEIQYQLLSPVIELEEDTADPRQTAATDIDVSLQLPEDVNPDLLDSLLRELPGHTAEFTRAVTRLTEGTGTLADAKVAQRVAHTLKGAANTVGIGGIASLTHHIEDILISFNKHERLPGAALSDCLLRAADTLEAMSESLLGMGPPPSDARQVLQEILDWANRIDNEGIPDDDAVAPPTMQTVEERSEAETVTAAQGEKDEQFAGDSILRVPAPLVDELLRLVGETVIINGQLHEQLRKATEQTHAAQQHNKLLQQLTFELEQLVDIQGLSWNQHRIEINQEFDALEMDQYNELHTVTRRLVEAASDSQEFAHNIEAYHTGLDGLIVDQSRLHKLTQENVMKTRMVPVQNIVPRLQRGVRQAARLTDKKVALDVIGMDTMMDSEVLNNLIDPLMHILRNAIDHGIEQEYRRLAHGKDPVGHVTLTFLREGDQMVVQCRDDGAGLDYAAIRTTAIERDIITPEQDISEAELRRFILQQGFSTRTQATQISGRGIGMDAVYNRIISLKGSLSLDSETGKGVTVELRLPVTFISVHGLLVRSRNRVVTFSSRGVEQILYPGAGTLHERDGELYYQLGEMEHRAVHLDTLLHLGEDRRGRSRHEQPALLVKEDSGALRVVLIEEVLASQDLVVKGLGHYLPPIAGIEGATILGDGSVAAVIDLPDLLRAETHQDRINRGLVDDVVLETQLPCALVVDDSLTARRTLAEFIQDMGYEVRSARDGLEAIDVINNRRPDIILVDLEMPRMNGLELTSHVRARQETRDIPIIMITSRSTEKHRQQAEAAGVNLYLTKPFSEDELMQHIEQLQALPA